ncbi:hypothetical protein [Sphingobium sp. BS19]|uniref:hypothetical protein n=1 Tax=Sphingobium sp. BS19 TaxID=3018973 RepID=UPI0022ED8F37|nr:hypothetical protein [Sphingobium sp. BS19]GLI99376.1 hypothetical protein Sbs19_31940 [Sphingobium sp. BS19]
MNRRGAIGAQARHQWILAVLLLAMFARLLVPAGWMPSTDVGRGYTITLCTGSGAMAAWVDADGTVRKNKPATSDRTDQPCAFAGFLNIVALADPVGQAVRFVLFVLPQGVLPIVSVAIGRGLAAPPPPPTGPPAIL